MLVLLKILIESLVLIGFLYIGKSVMKAQVSFKALLFTGLAGAFASQVPFVGTFLSFGVILYVENGSGGHNAGWGNDSSHRKRSRLYHYDLRRSRANAL
jgi:hypothetical protein